MENETAPTTPPASSSPTPEQKPSSNALIITIVVLIVLMVIAIAIFWIFSIRQAKDIANEQITENTSATVTATASAASSVSPDDYIIFDSNTREVTKGELQALSEWQLKVARNEIYARHGRKFEHQDLQCYFDNQSWYTQKDDFSESSLSTMENKNIATILAYEQEINSSYLNYDSGCSNL